MNFKVSILLIAALVFALPDLEAQRTGRYDYGNEFLWGVSKNTTGGLIGGFVFRKARKIDEDVFESFGLELTNIKHHKEFRRNSIRTGSFFVYGKLNNFFSARMQYGREFILFHKSPVQGAEIKLNLAAGPSLGFLKPYYVDVYIDGSLNNLRTVAEPYDPERHQFQEIAGQGNVFLGFSESSLRIGANAKAGVSFELGTLKSQVTGFEVGVLLDAYAGPVEIMYNTPNRSVFPTAYISLFYGARK